MKILLCGINYAPDLIGIAKYNTELCETLSANGHEVRVVTAPPYYPAWEIPPAYRGWGYRSEQRTGVQVRRAPIYVPQQPSGAKRLIHHASFALTSAGPVIAQALRWHPQIVFAVAPSLMSCAIPAVVARRTGAHSWLHLQDFEVDAAFDLGLLRNRRLRQVMLNVERRILRSYDRVSTIAPQMEQRLADKGVEASRLRQVRNWIDTSEIIPGNSNTIFREQLGIGAADMVGLYSGTMSSKQGLDLIIAAARDVAPSHPNVRFVLCGEGPEQANLRAMAAGLQNVNFLGLQPNARFTALLNTADFHLVPQRAEAADLVLPSKLGGILASGRPVITMAATGTGLADEVAGAGLVVPPGDADALADAIRRLAGDADSRHRLGANARLRAMERWDKTTILRGLMQEFSTLCGPAG